MKQYLLGFVASFAASATFASGPVELSHLELDLSYNDVGDNLLDTFGPSDVNWMSIGFNAGLSFGAFLTEVDFQRERLSESGDSINFDTLTLGLGYRIPAGGVASSFGDTVIFLEYGEVSVPFGSLDVLGFGVNSYNDQFGLGVAYEQVTADGAPNDITSWSVWGEYFVPNTPVTLGLGFTRADTFGEDTDILKLSAAYTFTGSNLTPYIEAKRLDAFGLDETFYNIGIRFTFGPNGAGATSPGNLMVGSNKARATSPFGVKETPIILIGGGPV